MIYKCLNCDSTRENWKINCRKCGANNWDCEAFIGSSVKRVGRSPEAPVEQPLKRPFRWSGNNPEVTSRASVASAQLGVVDFEDDTTATEDSPDPTVRVDVVEEPSQLEA